MCRASPPGTLPQWSSRDRESVRAPRQERKQCPEHKSASMLSVHADARMPKENRPVSPSREAPISSCAMRVRRPARQCAVARSASKEAQRASAASPLVLKSRSSLLQHEDLAVARLWGQVDTVSSLY